MRFLHVRAMLAALGVLAPIGVIGAAGAGLGSTGSAAAAAAPASQSGLVLYHVPLIGRHLLGTTLGAGRRNITDVQSSNWSGYADTSDTFGDLSSSWTEPTANCSKGGLLGLGLGASYAAFWVGLDGYSSTSVEQTGTDSDCTSSGSPSYYAWYEMYPAGSVDLSTTKYPVKPGDAMSASVTSNTTGSSFILALQDPTENWNFSITLAGSGLARSSAEFVAEAPSECNEFFCRQLKLADFGTVNFSNASVTDTGGHVGTISSFTDVDMQMAANGTVKATPGGLNSAGNGFSVTWQHS
jgi:hypothetical protein